MLEMPNSTIVFARDSRVVAQIEILENALENERDIYMRCCIKNAIERLKK